MKRLLFFLIQFIDFHRLYDKHVNQPQMYFDNSKTTRGRCVGKGKYEKRVTPFTSFVRSLVLAGLDSLLPPAKEDGAGDPYHGNFRFPFFANDGYYLASGLMPPYTHCLRQLLFLDF